jgi:GNAT superfamily N-acetyltransferase
MEIGIRKGRLTDLPSVLELVRELADYEKSPEEVDATLQTYEDGFREGLYDLIVAELDGAILGMALYYPIFSTWKGKKIYLEDIIVTELHRRSGAGKLIFEALLEEARAMGASGMRWQVLNWNEPAIRFYKKYPTHFDDEWINCKLTF